MTTKPRRDQWTTETRIRRAQAPTCYRLAKLRRWRWDVTYYAVADTDPGVKDRRIHQSGDCGYTFTWLGAALSVARRAAS